MPLSASLDLQPHQLSAIHNNNSEMIYTSIMESFNKIQMQIFQVLYISDKNLLPYTHCTIPAVSWTSFQDLKVAKRLSVLQVRQTAFGKE